MHLSAYIIVEIIVYTPLRVGLSYRFDILKHFRWPPLYSIRTSYVH